MHRSTVSFGSEWSLTSACFKQVLSRAYVPVSADGALPLIEWTLSFHSAPRVPRSIEIPLHFELVQGQVEKAFMNSPQGLAIAFQKEHPCGPLRSPAEAAMGMEAIRNDCRTSIISCIRSMASPSKIASRTYIHSDR